MRPTRLLAIALLLPALSLAMPPTAADPPSVLGAVFADESGAYLADVAMDGACNGPASLTVTIHRPTGDDVRTADATSFVTSGACGGGLRCNDCPPAPYPFAWTLEGEGVLLAGGGAGYYENYGYWTVAWSLQGPFQEGLLEIHGVLA